MNRTQNLGLTQYETTDRFRITQSSDSLNKDMEIIDEAITGKMTKPSNGDGASNQVLRSDGYGGSVWDTMYANQISMSDTDSTTIDSAIGTINQKISKILPVITGSYNNSGYPIASGEYFEANGNLYKATADIPLSNAWGSSATLQGDHGAVNALNGSIELLNSNKIGKVGNILASSAGFTATGQPFMVREDNGGWELLALINNLRKPGEIGFSSISELQSNILTICSTLEIESDIFYYAYSNNFTPPSDWGVSQAHYSLMIHKYHADAISVKLQGAGDNSTIVLGSYYYNTWSWEPLALNSKIVTQTGTISFENTVNNQCVTLKKSGEMKCINGILEIVSSIAGNNEKIFTLPDGFRPSAQTYVCAYTKYGGVYSMIRFFIDTNGEVKTSAGSSVVTEAIFFNIAFA